ncbi:hypothetical protein RUND412_008188, partial [Rhizina undulata]
GGSTTNGRQGHSQSVASPLPSRSSIVSERVLQSNDVTDLDVESVRIMQYDHKEEFDAVFKFYSIAVARTVKNAMGDLGYDVVYDKDPCEGRVEELSDSFALVELVESADV